MPARYSVVVVTWQCAPALERLVTSMNANLDRRPELVVVDNHSSDDPESAISSWQGERAFVALDANHGFGLASNVGVTTARHEALVLLNPDTEVGDGSLADLAACAVAGQALVGPRVLNPDRSIQPSASGSPVGPWPWVNAVVPGALMPASLKRRTEPWRLGKRTPVAWLTGACIAAPRQVLLSLGPFDPAIHMYGEDLDLGIRAGLAGVPSCFCPDVCRVIHHADESSSQRFADAGLSLSAKHRRAVLRRAYGPAVERRAWRAYRLNLLLRRVAKGVLGRDPEGVRAVEQAARAAKNSIDLSSFDAQGANALARNLLASAEIDRS